MFNALRPSFFLVILFSSTALYGAGAFSSSAAYSSKYRSIYDAFAVAVGSKKATVPLADKEFVKGRLQEELYSAIVTLVPKTRIAQFELIIHEMIEQYFLSAEVDGDMFCGELLGYIKEYGQKEKSFVDHATVVGSNFIGRPDTEQRKLLCAAFYYYFLARYVPKYRDSKRFTALKNTDYVKHMCNDFVDNSNYDPAKKIVLGKNIDNVVNSLMSKGSSLHTFFIGVHTRINASIAELRALQSKISLSAELARREADADLSDLLDEQIEQIKEKDVIDFFNIIEVISSGPALGKVAAGKNGGSNFGNVLEEAFFRDISNGVREGIHIRRKIMEEREERKKERAAQARREREEKEKKEKEDREKAKRAERLARSQARKAAQEEEERKKKEAEQKAREQQEKEEADRKEKEATELQGKAAAEKKDQKKHNKKKKKKDPSAQEIASPTPAAEEGPIASEAEQKKSSISEFENLTDDEERALLFTFFYYYFLAHHEPIYKTSKHFMQFKENTGRLAQICLDFIRHSNYSMGKKWILHNNINNVIASVIKEGGALQSFFARVKQRVDASIAASRRAQGRDLTEELKQLTPDSDLTALLDEQIAEFSRLENITDFFTIIEHIPADHLADNISDTSIDVLAGVEDFVSSLLEGNEELSRFFQEEAEKEDRQKAHAAQQKAAEEKAAEDKRQREEKEAERLREEKEKEDREKAKRAERLARSQARKEAEQKEEERKKKEAEQKAREEQQRAEEHKKKEADELAKKVRLEKKQQREQEERERQEKKAAELQRKAAEEKEAAEAQRKAKKQQKKIEKEEARRVKEITYMTHADREGKLAAQDSVAEKQRTAEAARRQKEEAERVAAQEKEKAEQEERIVAEYAQDRRFQASLSPEQRYKKQLRDAIQKMYYRCIGHYMKMYGYVPQIVCTMLQSYTPESSGSLLRRLHPALLITPNAATRGTIEETQLFLSALEDERVLAMLTRLHEILTHIGPVITARETTPSLLGTTSRKGQASRPLAKMHTIIAAHEAQSKYQARLNSEQQQHLEEAILERYSACLQSYKEKYGYIPQEVCTLLRTYQKGKADYLLSRLNPRALLLAKINNATPQNIEETRAFLRALGDEQVLTMLEKLYGILNMKQVGSVLTLNRTPKPLDQAAAALCSPEVVTTIPRPLRVATIPARISALARAEALIARKQAQLESKEIKR